MVSKSGKNMQEIFHEVREEELQFQLKKTLKTELIIFD